MLKLSPAERKALRARAHRLQPVVMIGEAGLTPAVMREIDLALQSHELIKVRVHGEDRQQRTILIDEICRALGAAAVQQIGKVLIVYRPRPDEVRAGPSQPHSPRRKEKRRSKRSYQMP